jgi:hypothetical protein
MDFGSRFSIEVRVCCRDHLLDALVFGVLFGANPRTSADRFGGLWKGFWGPWEGWPCFIAYGYRFERRWFQQKAQQIIAKVRTTG